MPLAWHPWQGCGSWRCCDPPLAPADGFGVSNSSKNDLFSVSFSLDLWDASCCSECLSGQAKWI